MNRIGGPVRFDSGPGRGRLRLWPAVLAVLWFGTGQAQDTRLDDPRLEAAVAGREGISLWRFCGRDGLLPELPPPEEPPAEGQLRISADRIESDTSGTRLSGDVSVIGHNDRMTADSALLHPGRQRTELTGNVHYRSDLVEFNAESLTREADSGTSTASELEFFVPLKHINGGAERMVRPGPQTTRLFNMTYSTCDPNDREWHFEAEEMELDHAAGFGTGKHMTVRIKDIPVFYFPYLTFPIDDRRRTGFLYPAIGDSSRHGTELEMPWYWNIAPQADATITPHYMSRRGMKLDTEWRYMSGWSTNKLYSEFIDDDLAGTERRLLTLEHSGRFADNWSTRISGTEVSDADYFEDFGTELSSTSQVQLSRTASLTGNWDHWKLRNRLQTYQTLIDNVTAGNAPYRLLPEIELTGLYADFALGLDFEWNSTYTHFDQDQRLTAKRLDVWPRLSLPLGSAGWFVTPAVGSRYTTYRLDYPEGVNPPPDQPSDLSRSTPVTSLDTGLIFERSFGEDNGYLQTLEPRLFYLNVPYRDQDNIPVFDTRRPDFSLFQLFEENRFAGADRMGDSERLSGALTTRILERGTGKERLRLSLGQIRYYRDRRVSLRPGETPETGERSGLILEVDSQFADRWSTSLTAERNPDTGQADKGLFRVRYNRGNRYVLNLSYRYRRGDSRVEDDTLRQTDVSFNLPVGGRWSVAGRWNRDIEEDFTLEQFLGIEYESCCWAFRVLGREFLTSATQAGNRRFDTGIYFEFSFKGFTSAGSGIGTRLENGIIGYQDPYE